MTRPPIQIDDAKAINAVQALAMILADSGDLVNAAAFQRVADLAKLGKRAEVIKEALG